MPQKGPNVYEVKLTALRRRQDEKGGTPDLSKRWTFVQLQHDVTSAEDALRKMVTRFFELHPSDALLLPKGEKGFQEITSPGAVGTFLSAHDSEGDSYKVGNDLASLNVVKMPAMSGDTPTHLTPKSDKEYSERLHQNFEVGPAYETLLVQMPSPVKGETMSTIQYKGHAYRPIIVKESPLPALRMALMHQMDLVTRTTGSYIQQQASEAELSGVLRLASYLSDRITEETHRGVVSAAKKFQESGRVDDIDVLMKIQRVKDDLEMRGKDGDLADALRAIGGATTANDAVRAMKHLVELSPALNGETGDQAALSAVYTNIDGEEVPWVVYIKRSDWKGPTYIYDALTHMAYYDQLTPELYAKMEAELDDMAQQHTPDAAEESEEPDMAEEPESVPAPAEEPPKRQWA